MAGRDESAAAVRPLHTCTTLTAFHFLCEDPKKITSYEFSFEIVRTKEWINSKRMNEQPNVNE